MSDPYFLSKGSHATAADGRCAMEWVAYLAGEPHTDSPVCVGPVLTRFCVRFNDRLGDEERQKLRPYLARTIGTRGDGMDEQRIQMCREWLVRHALPFYLDRAGRTEFAARLRALPDSLTTEAVGRVLRDARDEAWSARCEAVDKLATKIGAELARRGFAGAAAAAVADAVAGAAAVADAVADTDAAADAVAAAVAGAAAVADAVAAAAAVADADAAAVAAAAAAAPWTIRNAVYRAVRGRMRARAAETAREFNRELMPSAFELLDRMLPTEVIQLPIAHDAEAVCALP